MDHLRLPLQDAEDVEVYSKRDKWKPGSIKGNPNSATSVGYTVVTDNGTFAKVPAERFRRRFCGTGEAKKIQYYSGVRDGWKEAVVYWKADAQPEDFLLRGQVPPE